MAVQNLLTFDLENWYDSEFIKNKGGDDFVLKGLKEVTTLLDKYQTKATFFVTGDVLQKYPRAVKQLHRQGHEIASHSYDHIMLNHLSDNEIKKNILLSKKTIRSVIGKAPLGFRAPSWSLKPYQRWIYEFLFKEGFVYSSSAFPIYMGAYGSWKFPTDPHIPLKNCSFLEIPPRPFVFGPVRIPFCGGVYFRLLPLFLIRYFIRELNRQGKKAIIYLHPWEFCTDLPRVKTSLIGKIVSYWGTAHVASKLEALLQVFTFTSIEKELQDGYSTT